MRREQLETALRAAAAAAGTQELILAGSQAVFAHTADAPPEVPVSEECDVWAKGLDEKLEGIAPALGKLSPFHGQHGFYVDPVDPGLVLLPAGWEARLKRMDVPPVIAWCLDVGDLVISKLKAGG